MTYEQPECQMGYTREQLSRILGDRLPAFYRWHAGQTSVLCEGQRYNHNTRQYEPDGCGPHGAVVFPIDLERFMERTNADR